MFDYENTYKEGADEAQKSSNRSAKKKSRVFSDENSCETSVAAKALLSPTSINAAKASSSNLAVTAEISTASTYNIIVASAKECKVADIRASNQVFGLSLEIIMQRTGQPLPQKIIEGMKILRKVAPRAVGIFRKNGVKTRIKRLKEAIDSNEEFKFQKTFTIFDIADMIKLYFRELPECLITNKLSDVVLTNYSRKRLILAVFSEVLNEIFEL